MAKKKKEQKPITVSEFKIWIAGFEELSDGENWSPSPTQWKKIRDKIELIDESVVAVKQQQQASAANVQKQVVPTTPPVGNMTPPPPSGLGRPPQAAQPRMTASIPARAPMLTTDPAPKGTSLASAPVVKTPEVDSTDGNYATPFV